MPGSIPPSDVTTMRSGFTHVKRYLSVIPRTSVYTAVVSSVNRDPDTNGIYQINFSSGSGTLSDVKVGYTIDVGSTAGARDIGVLRVRKAPTSGVFFVAETAPGAVNVQAGQHLTARIERRPWWKYPRGEAVRDSSNYINSITEFSDYDIAYTNQNQNIQPQANIYADSSKNQVCMAGFVDPNTLVRTMTFYGEIVVMAEGATPAGSPYLWDVGDGTITVGSATSQSITVTFPSSTLFRYISLTVQDSNGTTHTRYMPIWSHSTTAFPMVNFSVRRDERKAEYGREMTFEFFGADGTVTTSVIPQGAGYCYWEEAEFGAAGTPAPPAYIDCFYGWALNDEKPLVLNNRSRYIVTVGGIASWLEKYTSFPATLRNTGAAATVWHEMRHATIPRAIHYALRRYSNALEIGNFEPGAVSAVAQAIDLKDGSLWSQIQDLATAMYMSEIGADSTNNLRIRRKYSYTNVYANDGTLLVGERTPIPVPLALTASDWLDQDPPALFYNETDAVGVVNGAGGFWNEGDTDTTPLRAIAPGKTPGVGVSKVDLPGQYLAPLYAQERLNSLCNHHFYHENNRFPNISLRLIHNLDVIEPCDNEPITLTWTASTITNVQLSAVKYCVRAVTVNHLEEAPYREVTWELERETIAPRGGETVDVPETPITISPPNPPGYIPPTYNPGELGQGTGRIAIFCTDNTLRRTSNFTSTNPTWNSVTLSSLSGWGGGTLVDFTVDAYSPLYLGSGSTVNGWIMTTSHVQRITDIFGATPALSTAHALPFTVASGCMNFERGVQNWGICVQHRNAASGGTSVAYTTDGLTWTNVNINANYENNYINNGSIWTPGLYVSPHSAGRAYVSSMLGLNTAQGSGFQAYVTTNYGASWTLLSTSTCNITDNMFNAGCIVVPYQNTGGTTAYFGGREQPGSFVTMQLLRAVGSSKTDISPVVSGEAFGIDFNTGNRQVAVADSDQNTVVLCGTHRNGTNGVRKYGVFVSRNAGNTWTTVIQPTTTEADQPYKQVYIAGDNPNTWYLIGINLSIAQVLNGSIIRNKKGNLSGSAVIKGLCGG